MILSINQNTNAQLLQLREQLSVFRTVTCGLMHEEVEELLDDAVTEEADLESMRVRRKGFCAMGMRRNWLGCAHSRSNDMFARLADDVHSTGILGSQSRPSEKINELVMKIYSLDHEKGRTEKMYALARQQGAVDNIKEVQQLLSDIIDRHQQLLKQLEDIRLMLLHRLNNAIGAYNNKATF